MYTYYAHCTYLVIRIQNITCRL